jgi:molybdate transport system substrate-binding protein
MKRILLVFLLALLCFSACTPKSVTLTVMAAASLTEAFQEIAQQFEMQNPGVRVSVNFASSQQLAQQLAEGSPADVFASANQKQMRAAVDSGRVDGGAIQAFAQNRLALIYPVGNPAGLDRLEDLARPGVKLVMASKEVPVGQYSLEFLEKAGQAPALGPAFPQAVLKNVVSYEGNVKAVLNKVVLGEADAGIVYNSDVSGEAANKVRQVTIPDELNVIANYPIAAIKDSQHAAQAQAFVELVLSPAGQEILAKYGFMPVVK